MNRYETVSRTFTYGIYAILILLISYEADIFYYLETAPELGARNNADILIQEILTLGGLLPSFTTGFILIAGLMFALNRERRMYGIIPFRISFFARTLCESFVFALPLLGFSLLFWFVSGGKYAAHAISFIPHVIALKSGAAVYEELLFRVILLGRSIAVFQKFFRRHASIMLALIISSVAFGQYHYFHVFGLDVKMSGYEELYFMEGAGFYLGIIYLRKGFATAVWTHVFFIFWELVF